MAFSNNSDSGAISDINVTPLVDVLLVLLIIFMVTAPTVSYPIDVNLPQPTSVPPPVTQEPPPPIQLRIDATGQVFWNNNPTPIAAIPGMMKETVQRDPTNQPLLEIDTNEDAEYGTLAKVLAYAKNADMKKIGFVQK
ncbi:MULTISPECIES: biopolymer transporter ExbD [Lysobacter]|jgi:biopolymer transport protein ExbD|uniref:Biopolymer transport protein ExbD/TolR n=1 Tax=Lysobacter capsici AZ78 TaxID=1444315 RepID=A0A108UA91_9GAMM|nr:MULTISPECIES: biopolymer transporter ExbD [Lysobacter]ALN83317.1 biopolymer transport ExbD/TolR family protein [Lysobacter capsici]ATE69912.1 biopolymer transporter ExbD [Lysobacter capsici]KRB07706.1 biopolymer transporter ExbD [Lysobacter sp. Root690]KWS05429.1 Biopolymer transport protein ExbD/TolR [Lysobacter capsici AZ78]UOF15096.1 biopolymer transporter ExbD [Lysobacter capsici]